MLFDRCEYADEVSYEVGVFEDACVDALGGGPHVEGGFILS
jgi:hypothetical protein